MRVTQGRAIIHVLKGIQKLIDNPYYIQLLIWKEIIVVNRIWICIHKFYQLDYFKNTYVWVPLIIQMAIIEL